VIHGPNDFFFFKLFLCILCILVYERKKKGLPSFPKIEVVHGAKKGWETLD